MVFRRFSCSWDWTLKLVWLDNHLAGGFPRNGLVPVVDCAPCPPPEISAAAGFPSAVAFARGSGAAHPCQGEVRNIKHRRRQLWKRLHRPSISTTSTQITIGPRPAVLTRAWCVARVAVGEVAADGGKPRHYRTAGLGSLRRRSHLAPSRDAGVALRVSLGVRDSHGGGSERPALKNLLFTFALPTHEAAVRAASTQLKLNTRLVPRRLRHGGASAAALAGIQEAETRGLCSASPRAFSRTMA